MPAVDAQIAGLHPRKDCACPGRIRSLRAVVWQVLIIGLVLLIAWYLISNTSRNLAARHIATGFGFLGRVAGIPIGESLIPYDPAVEHLRPALGSASSIRWRFR